MAIITSKLVIMFKSQEIGLYDCLVDYDRDIEIDEGNFWRAHGIGASDEDPYMSVYGDLDGENRPTTDNLIVYVEHSPSNVETITDIKVLECE
jgi:hypothetical protein